MRRLCSPVSRRKGVLLVHSSGACGGWQLCSSLWGLGCTCFTCRQKTIPQTPPLGNAGLVWPLLAPDAPRERGHAFRPLSSGVSLLWVGSTIWTTPLAFAFVTAKFFTFDLRLHLCTLFLCRILVTLPAPSLLFHLRGFCLRSSTSSRLWPLHFSSFAWLRLTSLHFAFVGPSTPLLITAFRAN